AANYDESYILSQLDEARAQVDDRLDRFGFEGTTLVFADSVEQAETVTRLANCRFGAGSAGRATADDPNAHRIIDDFRERLVAARILVTVGMAGEGCDIPHLAVGCWLSCQRTELVFIQRGGRFVRRTKGEHGSLTAVLLLPAHPDL